MSGRGKGHNRIRPTWWAAGVLLVGAAATAGLYFTAGDTGQVWLPHISVGFATLALTITFVEWIVRRERTEHEWSRVELALEKVERRLRELCVSVLHDYERLHRVASYETPPRSFRDLLAHFERGLTTVDGAWPPDLRMLDDARRLSEQLMRQIDRHGSTLDNDFIAAADRFKTASYNAMTKYRREHQSNAEALVDLVSGIGAFLDVYEPYALRYFGEDAKVELSEREVAHFNSLNTQTRSSTP